MRFKVHIIASVLMLALVLGCGTHQQRVNTISNGIDKLSSGYQFAANTAADLHDAGMLTGQNWETAKAVNAKADVAMRKIWAAWRLLPQTDASIAEFYASPTFLEGVALAIELAKLAGLENIVLDLKRLEVTNENQ